MSLTTAHSAVAPSSNAKLIAGTIIIAYALISIVPLLWIFATSFKTPPDSIAYPPKIVFQPSIEGYCNLFTTRTRQTPEYINSLGPATGFCDETVRTRYMVPLADDLLFFILSTRFMPPIAVAIPIYLMYRELGLSDTALGMILLYTAVNVSLAVWLLKGFIDEIPREYEEAAMVDGYTRLQAFWRTVLPQATTGIAATDIFCLIFAWHEYAIAALLA